MLTIQHCHVANLDYFLFSKVKAIFISKAWTSTFEASAFSHICVIAVYTASVTEQLVAFLVLVKNTSSWFLNCSSTFVSSNFSTFGVLDFELPPTEAFDVLAVTSLVVLSVVRFKAFETLQYETYLLVFLL